VKNLDQVGPVFGIDARVPFRTRVRTRAKANLGMTTLNRGIKGTHTN